MADTDSMFYQVTVPDCDSSFLRFLWWENGELAREPQEFQIIVHPFGAVSSPVCANFALRKTAEDNQHSFPPSVINTVKRSFYVDDCFKSLPSEADAIQHIDSLWALLSHGGFKISKWINNSRNVLETIPELEWSRTSRTSTHARTNYQFSELLECNGVWRTTHFASKSV